MPAGERARCERGEAGDKRTRAERGEGREPVQASQPSVTIVCLHRRERSGGK
jgi:hypothetical protein